MVTQGTVTCEFSEAPDVHFVTRTDRKLCAMSNGHSLEFSARGPRYWPGFRMRGRRAPTGHRIARKLCARMTEGVSDAIEMRRIKRPGRGLGSPPPRERLEGRGSG